MIGNILYYVLIAALRDKLIISVFLGAALAVSISLFLGSAAIIEKDQFSIVFAAGMLRIFGICGLVLFCVTFIRRSFETKDVEFLLARPISRTTLIISYSAAFSMLALLFALSLSAVIYANIYSKVDVPSFALWALSLSIEYIITVNVALFFSMVVSSTTGATLAVMGFYIFARMSGQFLGIIDSAKASDVIGSQSMEYIIQFVSVIIPRFDLIAQSAWLIYGVEGGMNVTIILLQGAVYTSLLILATLRDLISKQF